MTRLALLLVTLLLLAACDSPTGPQGTPASGQVANIEVGSPDQAGSGAPRVDPGAPADHAGGPRADPASCVTYDAAYERAPLMRVRGAADERAHFHDRAEACPGSGACEQRREGYVVGGDLVFVSAPVNGFRCVYAGAAKGDLVAGFVSADSLEPAPDAEPLTPEFLAGRWRHLAGDEIVFARRGDGVTARGQATYDSGGPGGPNVGEFGGAVAIEGRTARYADEACTVTATRRGSYLVVNDNLGCGGMNVAFRGIYTRAGG